MPGIPEEEFKSWYSVRDAVEVLKRHGLDTHEARQSILHGLRTDGIRSGAERTVKTSKVPNKQNEDLRFATMRSDHWLLDEPPEAFWSDGTATLRKKGVPDFHYRHFGIRLERAGIDKLAAQQAATSERHPTSGRLEPDEFDAWVTLAELVAAVPIKDYETKRRSIHRRMSDGLIRTAAETVVDSGGRHERVVLPRQTWAIFDLHDDFWRTAEFEHVAVESTGYDRRVDFRCYGIRFDPRDVRRFLASHAIRDTALQEPAAPDPRVKPPYAATVAAPPEKPRKVTKDELRQWFPGYVRENQDFREHIVRAKAAAHFAPRPVTRQPVREIIGEFDRTLTRGKPTGT